MCPNCYFSGGLPSSSSAPPAGNWLHPLVPVTGVISSICVGRGRDFYGGERNVETRALQAALGGEAKLVNDAPGGSLSLPRAQRVHTRGERAELVNERVVVGAGGKRGADLLVAAKQREGR